MAVGDILADLRMTPLSASTSGTQQQFAFKPSGLLCMFNRSGSNPNELVVSIVNVDIADYAIAPFNLPNARQFSGTSTLFSVQVSATSTGFALMYIEDDGGTSRRLRYAHILDNGTVDVQPKNILSDVTAQFNIVTHMRPNAAGTRLGILFNTEVSQGSDPRLFRAGEIDLSGNFTAGPFTLDQTMGGTAQVTNLQNPRLAADLDDSGWGIFWGSNQGGAQPGGFWYAHFLTGGTLNVSKTLLFDTPGDENNLHDVVATNTGFAALILREVSGSSDTGFYVRVDANGTNVSTTVNVSQAIQGLEGQPFNPGFVSSRGGALQPNTTNGGAHLISQETILGTNTIEFLPSDVDDSANTISLPGVFGPFTIVEANFNNVGGSLPIPLTTQPNFWIISNEHTGNDDLFYIYTDFLDALLDQNRTDLTDTGSGTHQILQSTSFSWYAYIDFAEDGTVRNGPFKALRIPQTFARNSQILQLSPISDDEILITWLETDEASTQTFKSVTIDRTSGTLNTQFVLPISGLPGTEQGRDFGGLLLTNEKRVAFRFHLLGSSTSNPNFLTLVDALLGFRAIQDDGLTNLVADNLEVTS